MKPERFIDRILAEWPSKVLSLAAALLLFFVFSLTRLEQRYLSVPLAVSINNEFVPSSQYPRSVRVALRGEQDTLFTIREEDIGASLDLTSYRSEGIFRVPVRIERRGAALAADPLEIVAEPGEVAIGLERRSSRSLPVTPSFRGFLETGYELVSFDLKPSEVEVSGPAGAVARAVDIATESIELTGRKSDFSLDIRLVRKDTLVSPVTSDTVRFSARVRKTVASRTLDTVPIGMRGLSPGLALADSLPAGAVRLHQGTAEADIAKVSISGLLWIDLSPFAQPGQYTVPVYVRVPEGTVMESYEPQSIAVRLVPAANGPGPAGGPAGGQVAPGPGTGGVPGASGGPGAGPRDGSGQGAGSATGAGGTPGTHGAGSAGAKGSGQ